MRSVREEGESGAGGAQQGEGEGFSIAEDPGGLAKIAGSSLGNRCAMERYDLDLDLEGKKGKRGERGGETHPSYRRRRRRKERRRRRRNGSESQVQSRVSSILSILAWKRTGSQRRNEEGEEQVSLLVVALVPDWKAEEW